MNKLDFKTIDFFIGAPVIYHSYFLGYKRAHLFNGYVENEYKAKLLDPITNHEFTVDLHFNDVLRCYNEEEWNSLLQVKNF